MFDETDPTPTPERREASAWRAAKGTDPAMYAVARATGFRADNRLMTEQEFDQAIEAASSFTLR